MSEDPVRRGFAEFVGAFTLIFIGGGAGIVSHSDIVAVFTWGNRERFWKSRLLSPAKLRKHWDTVSAQRNSAKENGNGNGSNGRTSNANNLGRYHGSDHEFDSLKGSARIAGAGVGS